LPTDPGELTALLNGTWVGAPLSGLYEGSYEWYARFRTEDDGRVVGVAEHLLPYTNGIIRRWFDMEILNASGAEFSLQLTRCRSHDTPEDVVDQVYDCDRHLQSGSYYQDWSGGFLSRDEIWLFRSEFKLKRSTQVTWDPW